MNASRDELPYRPGVGIMMFNDQKQIFVAHRLFPLSKAWQMPQGGLEEGEEPSQGVLRELEEETSVKTVRIIAETTQWYSYNIPSDVRAALKLNEYQGQRQKWFALHFQGSEAEINLNTFDPEFDDWKWVSVEELPSLIVSFKEELYRQVIQELWPFIDRYEPSKRAYS